MISRIYIQFLTYLNIILNYMYREFFEYKIFLCYINQVLESL